VHSITLPGQPNGDTVLARAEKIINIHYFLCYGDELFPTRRTGKSLGEIQNKFILFYSQIDCASAFGKTNIFMVYSALKLPEFGGM
jgi:hypothetical protein